MVIIQSVVFITIIFIIIIITTTIIIIIIIIIIMIMIMKRKWWDPFFSLGSFGWRRSRGQKKIIFLQTEEILEVIVIFKILTDLSMFVSKTVRKKYIF